MRRVIVTLFVVLFVSCTHRVYTRPVTPCNSCDSYTCYVECTQKCNFDAGVVQCVEVKR